MPLMQSRIYQPGEKQLDSNEEIRRFCGHFFVLETTNETMKAEAILKDAGIACRLFPKPRHIITECGLIIKVLDSELEAAKVHLVSCGINIKEEIII